MPYERTCPKCGKTITYTTKRARDASIGKLCRSCSNKSKSVYNDYKIAESKWNLPCPKCGADRIYDSYKHLKRNSKKTCRRCSQLGKRYPKNKELPFTKGALTTWAKQIKKRDCCCQKCGATENLEAHHLFNKALMPELGLCLGNGIALCNPCHRELHSIIGKPRA